MYPSARIKVPVSAITTAIKLISIIVKYDDIIVYTGGLPESTSQDLAL